MRPLLVGALVVLALVVPTTTAFAATYYVSTTGNDSSNGLYADYQSGSNGPWLTIQKAANTLVAGDTVLIRGGLYASANRIEPKNSGTATAYITYKAYPGEHPEIKTGMSQGIWVSGTSAAKKGYLEFNGLTVTAAPSFVTESCGTGILIEYGHHIRVINNIIRGSGGGGVSFETGSDYGLVEGNIVYDNCWGCSSWRGSGINFHRLWWYDQAPGYHNIARRNLVYHNYHDPTYVLNHSDGNAMIVDEGNSSDPSGTNPPVLFENNLAFDNAGPCFNIFNSSNTTFVNNTCYQNESDPYEINSGEINIDGGINIQAYNNILVPRNGAKASRQGSSSSNLTLDYNLNFCGSTSCSTYTTGTHDINRQDPLFINPSLDPQTADFHLQAASPAIDKALAGVAPAVDYDHAPRPAGSGYDVGAYEYDGAVGPPITPPVTLTPTPSPLPPPMVPINSWFEAESGAISAPLTIATGNGVTYISQSSSNSNAPALGGAARYRFTVPTQGNYLVKGIIHAPSDPSSSFFVNIDSEPVDDTMSWDVYPFTAGFTPLPVTWRGNGSYTTPQFNPQVFTLTPGEHLLIIRGREADTLLDKLIILPPANPYDFDGDGDIDYVDLKRLLTPFFPHTIFDFNNLVKNL